MSIHDRLMPGEDILSEFKPFYATSRRILRYREKPSGVEFNELTYDRLETIEMVRTPRHNLMISGTLIVIAALTADAIGAIRFTTFPAVIIGIAVVIFGGLGKEGYYQLHIRRADRGEERAWRIKFAGSGSFVATLRSVIGEIPDF